MPVNAPMRLPRTIAALLLCCLLPDAKAQMDTLWVPYHGGMDLREGVYLDFLSFRLNAPSVPIAQLRDDQGLPVTDLRTGLSRLRYTADSGEVIRLRANEIWGFCNNDAVYIAAGNGFYRIGLMGSLAHMVYERNYQAWDPYFYGATTVTVTVQQLIRMNSGEVLPFNASAMDSALADDVVLQMEFRALPKKQRNSDEALFRFLRLYNERHPLLFPQ